MDAILDQTTDVNYSQLAALNEVFEFPDYVKSASLDTECRGDRSKGSVGFADPAGQRFPHHTKAATWLSYAYLLHNRPKMTAKYFSKVAAALDKAVEYWGMPNMIGRLKEAYAETEKEALDRLPDNLFAYVWESESGKDRHLPMRSAAEASEAASWLQKHASHFSFDDRHKIATKILDHIDLYSAAIPQETDEFLQKQAGRGICDHYDVANQITVRARETRNPEIKARLTKLASVIKSQPGHILGPDQMVSFAQMMDTVDRSEGFVSRYGNGVFKSPEETVFSVPYSKMSSVREELCSLVTGNTYAKEAFSDLKLGEVSKLFGEAFVDSVSRGTEIDTEKMAEIATTLPLPDAELLEKLLAKNGQAPIHKAAAAMSYGFSFEALEELAKQAD